MKKSLIVLSLLILAGCKEVEVPETVIRPALVWTVSGQQETGSISYSGEIKARYEADLSFRVGGKIIARQVDLGDSVAAGKVLARLDTADLDLNLSSAQASLAAAEADYVNAKSELTRIEDLRHKQFIGQSALDSAKAAFDAASARVESARAQLKLSRNQAGYSDLKSDQPGVITQVNVETGQVVSAGQPILRIAYAGEREVHIRVGESTAQTLKAGAQAQIKLWSKSGEKLQGRVREVSPSADATRSFLVKIQLLNPPENLRLGVTADVSLPIATAGDAVSLPSSSLFQQQDKPAVWIVDADNKVSTQAVNVISYHENGIMVSGLPQGAQVVAAGVHMLHAGQEIKPVPYTGAARL